MGVNLMLMSLTTPVHLLTPQSVDGFWGGTERYFYSATVRKHTTLPIIHCKPLTATTTKQKSRVLS